MNHGGLKTAEDYGPSKPAVEHLDDQAMDADSAAAMRAQDRRPIILDDTEIPPRIGQRVGSSALEKLCIAIINAHPLPAGVKNAPTPGMRLSAALYALQGADYRDQPGREAYMDLQLRMAEHLYAVTFDPATPAAERLDLYAHNAKSPSYVRQLAVEALTEAGEKITRRAISFLCARFSARWPFLLNQIKLSDTGRHRLELQILTEIGQRLTEIGVENLIPQAPKMFWRLRRNDL